MLWRMAVDTREQRIDAMHTAQLSLDAPPPATRVSPSRVLLRPGTGSESLFARLPQLRTRISFTSFCTRSCSHGGETADGWIGRRCRRTWRDTHAKIAK